MRVHYINPIPLDKRKAQPRATIGGKPLLPTSEKWPECRLCKAPMIFFFQLDLQKGFDLPLKSGSHMVVFMCPQHNDVPTQLVEGSEDQLPDEYWRKTFGHYKLMLFKPTKHEALAQGETHIALRALNFEEAEEEIDWDGYMERGTQGFKVGGVPNWEGASAYTRCSCGAEMIFVCQLPRGFSFPANDKPASDAPDAVPKDHFDLFLGQATYIFACKQQCTPYSMHAISQDIANDMAESA